MREHAADEHADHATADLKTVKNSVTTIETKVLPVAWNVADRTPHGSGHLAHPEKQNKLPGLALFGGLHLYLGLCCA